MKKDTNESYDIKLLKNGVKYKRLGEYINSSTKIDHQCPTCGNIWPARPNGILSGEGCPLCAGNIKYTDKTYDTKLLEKGIKYVRIGEYVGSKVKILHLCPTCSNTWETTPSSILMGSGCPFCSGKLRYTNETYDAKLLEKGIKYLRIGEYINNTTKIEHKCTSCEHTWLVSPNNILEGSGCPFCSGKLRYTNETYDTKLVEKGDKYKRIGVYICNKTKIEHQCQECKNIWGVRPNDLLQGTGGCPVCAKNKVRSNAEQDLVDFIQSVYSGWIELNNRTILSGKELDIVLPDLGIAFEFNGVYWHQEKFTSKSYHLDKTKSVEAFEYQLIHVNEDEWEHKQDIVESRVKSLLGLSTRIYARKCSIREVTSDEANLFLNSNHIQGACRSTTRIGLYYDTTLVALMTFGATRFNNSYDYELLRYCSILNTTVIGGASKLLKAFRSTYAGSILSYADRRWSKGNLYKSLGFKFLHNSEPGYRYYKGLNSLSRYQCQKHKLVEMGFDESKTETEIMTERGYYKVYDCGNSVWVLE